MDHVSRIFSAFLLVFSFLQVFASSSQAFSRSETGKLFSIFEENGKVGLKDDQGHVVIPATHEMIGWSDGSFSLIGNVTGYRSNGRWGLISVQNHRITRSEYVAIVPGQGQLVIAHRQTKGMLKPLVGCMNISGKEIIPFQYDGIKFTSPLRAIVFNKSGTQYRYGLIDLENKAIIPQEYKWITSLNSLRYGVEDFQNKQAIFSDDGKQITSFVIDSLSSFKKDVAVLYQGQEQGVIDRDGIVRLEPMPAEIKIDTDGSIYVKKHDAWIFLTGENAALTQHGAEDISIVDTEVLKIKKSGKVYLTDRSFKALNEHRFDEMSDFINDIAIVRVAGAFGAIGRNGQIIVPTKYKTLQVDGKFFQAEQVLDGRRQWLLLDHNGKVLHTKTYDRMEKVSSGMIPVQHRKYWGALNLLGEEIIACVHDSLIQIQGDYVVVKFRGQYGVIDQKENWIVTPQPHQLRLLNTDRYLLTTPKTKFIKSMKSEVIYFSDNTMEFENDYIKESISTGEKWKVSYDGIVIGKESTPGEVEVIFPETEGLRAIKKDGRYGFIDSRGRLRIANRYEDAQPFSGTLAPVKIRGKWGFINHSDQIAVQPVYDQVFGFQNDRSMVKQKGLFGLIDTKGKLLLPVRYDTVAIHGDHYVIRQNGSWGLSDHKGVIIIQPKYDHIQYLGNGFIIVGREGQFGVLKENGVSTIPLMYDTLSYDSQSNQFIAVKRSQWERIQLK